MCSLFVRPGHYVVFLSHLPHAFSLQRLVLLPECCRLRKPAPPSNRMTTPSRAEKDTNTPPWDSRVHRWSPSPLSRNGRRTFVLPVSSPNALLQGDGRQTQASEFNISSSFITFIIYKQYASTVSFQIIANKSPWPRSIKESIAAFQGLVYR